MDINNATAEQLERTGQIDGTRARYLVEYRERRGPFGSWQDVKQVPSYEDGMVERLQSAGFSIGEERNTGGSSRARVGERRGPSAQSASTSSHDLNRASAEELEATHMIDGERARRIVEYRSQHGRFTDWDQVKQVPGIEDGIVARLRDQGYRIESGS